MVVDSEAIRQRQQRLDASRLGEEAGARIVVTAMRGEFGGQDKNYLAWQHAMNVRQGSEPATVKAGLIEGFNRGLHRR